VGFSVLRQLAERLGTSVNFLSFMERGIKAPSFENLERIADVLDVGVAELFHVPAPAIKQSQRVQRSTHGPKTLGRLRRS
jgi:transcriptional regulator with XRE-family HTH domain